MAYGSSTMTPVKETKPATPTGGKGTMTDKQKQTLKSHMEKMKKGGMSGTELKSHRMKMMVRMRKGMSVAKAHADIKK